MLLSSWILSKDNDCLTVDTIEWIFKNALNMDQRALYQLKTGNKAFHPLMNSECLYDEAQVEVLALFVMEPYFPCKHFNRAFSWLFGKENIMQINSGDFACYEQRVKENACYTLRNFWKSLSPASEEYLHLINEFSVVVEIAKEEQPSLCRLGFSLNHFFRDDFNDRSRIEFISGLSGSASNKTIPKEMVSQLIDCGVITASELDLKNEQACNSPLNYKSHHFYSDPSLFADALRVLPSLDDFKGVESVSELMEIELSSMLYSPHWTKELLLDLLDIAAKLPDTLKVGGSKSVDQNVINNARNFRENIFRKLFCESFYLSLDKEDLTGPYGRAENLLARLLDSDAHLLSEFDANLIASSGIQLTYCDEEVNLATSLAHHPELNEQIIAERLRLRTEQLNDTTTLARQRPAL